MSITSKNSNLTKAKAAKNDEFYTQYSDIEAELSHYEVKHFADRVVYLPCDDWHFSQFIKYFEDNFTRLQLKALVATGINFNGAGYYYKKTSEGVITGELQGNGDFRSDACRQLMREADIIVTNPPFSLFREFVAQIMEFRKKFLIIGNQNAFTYKEIFPLIKENKVWTGSGESYHGLAGFFGSAGYEDYATSSQHKDGLIRVSGVCWFTNLDHNKRHEFMLLDHTYDSAKYPKYNNYAAIEVAKSKEIPNDYFGVMGVPISWLHKYCPDQFEILGRADANIANEDNPYYISGYRDKGGAPLVNGEFVYKRLLIKRKTIPVEPEFLQSFVDGVERRS